MNWLVPFVQKVGSPFLPAIEALAPALAGAAHRNATNSDHTVAAFAVSTAVFGSICVVLTCWTLVRLRNAKDRAREDRNAAEVARGFREALLAGAAEGVVVLRNGNKQRQFFGDGKLLYDACIDSPQTKKMVRAIDSLTEEGTSFTLPVHAHGGSLKVRGLPVAGRAVLYIHKDETAGIQDRYRDILDSLPIPIWLRNAGNLISWANRAFVDALGFASLEEAVTANVALEWSERDLAARAMTEQESVEGRASVIVDGNSRVFSLSLNPMAEGGAAGFATDITDTVRLEAKLQVVNDAREDMVERIPFAIAVFSGDRNLCQFNDAYAQLWQLPVDWLNDRPSLGDILDRLRERRALPEQRNFPEWKQAQLNQFNQSAFRDQEVWHLPNGKSVRIFTQPHLEGGLFMMFEDISDRIQLESSLNLLTQVQKATLDTLDEGIAIFGTDGRLVLHNALFASLWQLTENELSGTPHFAEIADICSRRIGRDGIWGIVSCGINSATPERFAEWGKGRRADGKLLSLALTRLPNGATVVTFTDLTDVEQFSTQQAGYNYAAA